jgi:thiol-disulfide isomerase/thioredoxin
LTVSILRASTRPESGDYSVKVITLLFLLSLALPIGAIAGQVGTPAPDFTLSDLKGNAFTLKQFRGKVVFLDFWTPWCDPCREEFPALDALYKKYRNDGLEVIGIDIDDSEKLAAEFLQKIPVAFTILIDKKGISRRAYSFRMLPTAFIIGRDGVIRNVHMGFGKEFLQTYETEIAKLLKQQ